MNEPEIRQELVKRLSKRKAFSPDRLLEEVSLQNGLVRADLVYCSNRLECFEIKSQADTLKRLVSQGWQYEQSFDLVTLVCATKHLPQALEMIPEWWGVLEVTMGGGLKPFRKANPNPNVNALGMVDLLTNEESKLFLSSIEYGKGLSKLSHSQLKLAVQSAAKTPELRRWILERLRRRNVEWESRSQQCFQEARLYG